MADISLTQNESISVGFGGGPYFPLIMAYESVSVQTDAQMWRDASEMPEIADDTAFDSPYNEIENYIMRR